jgi:hypothetical protein
VFEQLSLTPLGDRLYRLALSRLCASRPDNGDLIEADQLPDGSLKFRRIVKRANSQKRGYLISKQTADSEQFARTSNRAWRQVGIKLRGLLRSVFAAERAL